VFSLRMDPMERADVVSDQYYDWLAKNAYLIQYGVGAWHPSWAPSKTIRRASVRRASASTR
jgi:hypothetical protein